MIKSLNTKSDVYFRFIAIIEILRFPRLMVKKPTSII